MPQILASFKDGKGLKDKYLDTSKNVLSSEINAHVQYEAIIYFLFRSYNHCQFF